MGCLSGFVAGVLLIALCPLPVSAQRGSAVRQYDPLLRTLRQDSIYIDKARYPNVDTAVLRVLTSQQPVKIPLKIAIVGELPNSEHTSGAQDRYTQALHDELGMRLGILIIVTPLGASVATNAIPLDQVAQVISQTPTRIHDPVTTVQSLIFRLDGELNRPLEAFGVTYLTRKPGGWKFTPEGLWLRSFRRIIPWSVILLIALVAVGGLCGGYWRA